jgi:hypothetical protein
LRKRACVVRMLQTLLGGIPQNSSGPRCPGGAEAAATEGNPRVGRCADLLTTGGSQTPYRPGSPVEQRRAHTQRSSKAFCRNSSTRAMRNCTAHAGGSCFVGSGCRDTPFSGELMQEWEQGRSPPPSSGTHRRSGGHRDTPVAGRPAGGTSSRRDSIQRPSVRRSDDLRGGRALPPGAIHDPGLVIPTRLAWIQVKRPRLANTEVGCGGVRAAAERGGL